MDVRIRKLRKIKELNMNVADMLLYIYQNEIHPSKKEIENIIKERKVNDVQALFLWLMDALEMDLDDPTNLSLCTKYFLVNINKQNVEKYAENPYVKAVKSLDVRDKKYALTYLNYEPYQLFPLDDLQVDEKDNFTENTPLGFFDKKYSFLALLENNKIWMSLNPNELNTMEPHINSAKGDILVLGLGLGYFPYMCSLKDEVKTITIIEKDENIINLFNKYLEQIFKNQNQIRIIQDDAIDYLRNNHNFDYIFADLWHDPIDGIDLYIELLEIQKRHSLNMSYWIENSLLALARRISISLIVKDDKNVLNEFKSAKKLAQALDVAEIKSINLSDDALRNILSK